jgi:hypothetical protein
MQGLHLCMNWAMFTCVGHFVFFSYDYMLVKASHALEHALVHTYLEPTYLPNIGIDGEIRFTKI